MKYLPALLLSLALLASVSLRAQSPDSLDVLRACQPRQGLPNVFDRLKSGGPVTIAYFGGSITEAAGGWREQSGRWFDEQYPRAQIRKINAAIGGTGSDLGVFRLRQDVLMHRPDLVFVEFAVNDNGLPPERIHQTMEGIVRQIWKANARTDICFVYTLTSTTAPTLAAGHLTPAMLAMEHIARHYGIPSVQLGLEVVERFKTDQLVFKGKPDDAPGKLVFSPDNVHPYPQTGHRLYTEALIRAMTPIRAQTRPVNHTLGQPFGTDNWEAAQLVSVQDLTRTGEWQKLDPAQDTVARQLRHRFRELYKATQPGSGIRVRFKGRLVGLYDVVGPGNGQYAVSVDGQPAQLYPRFDKYAVYYRSHYFFLPALTDGVHTVEWTVSGEPLDKMAILKQGTSQPGDPRKFTGNACYAGQLLLLGEGLK